MNKPAKFSLKFNGDTVANHITQDDGAFLEVYYYEGECLIGIKGYPEPLKLNSGQEITLKMEES